MTRCDPNMADICIDKAPYRFERLVEFREFRRLFGLKGVELPNREATFERLQADHDAMIRQRRLARRLERWAVNQFIAHMETQDLLIG